MHIFLILIKFYFSRVAKMLVLYVKKKNNCVVGVAVIHFFTCSIQVPGLAVVIVGHRKDSQSYVNMKRKACAEVGIKSFDVDLPEHVSEAEVISKVHELNALPDVHGWLNIGQVGIQ